MEAWRVGPLGCTSSTHPSPSCRSTEVVRFSVVCSWLANGLLPLWELPKLLVGSGCSYGGWRRCPGRLLQSSQCMACPQLHLPGQWWGRRRECFDTETLSGWGVKNVPHSFLFAGEPNNGDLVVSPGCSVRLAWSEMGAGWGCWMCSPPPGTHLHPAVLLGVPGGPRWPLQGN